MRSGKAVPSAAHCRQCNNPLQSGCGSPAFARALHTPGTAQSEMGDLVQAKVTLAHAATLLFQALGPNSAQAHQTEVELGWLELRTGNAAFGDQKARAALAAY